MPEPGSESILCQVWKAGFISRLKKKLNNNGMTGKDAGGRFSIICIKVENQRIGNRRGTTN